MGSEGPLRFCCVYPCHMWLLCEYLCVAAVCVCVSHGIAVFAHAAMSDVLKLTLL